MIAFDIEVLCDLLRDSNLSSKARLCYFVLHWFASKKNGCFPSYNDLAYTMNVSKESVNKAIKELERNRYIYVGKRQARNTRGKMRIYSNVYFMYNSNERFEIIEEGKNPNDIIRERLKKMSGKI